MNYVKYSTERLMEIPSRFTRLVWSYAAQSHVRDKEIWESFDFVSRIRRITRGKRVLEACCGHGLVGHLLALNGARSVRQFDIRETRSHALLQTYFLRSPVMFDTVDVRKQKDEVLSWDFDVVVGMHCCGDLSDIIVDIATKKGAALCICPCCYHGARMAPAMAASMNAFPKPLAVDAVRVATLALRGYAVTMKKLNISISTCNDIICAVPG
jgi:hypothetical protein